MGAGQLRKRVTFEEPVAIADGAGGHATEWMWPLTVWGAIMPERGRERLQAGRLESPVAGILRIRSSSQVRTITEAHRATIDGVPYQIRSIVNPDSRGKYLDMVVERGVAT